MVLVAKPPFLRAPNEARAEGEYEELVREPNDDLREVVRPERCVPRPRVGWAFLPGTFLFRFVGTLTAT